VVECGGVWWRRRNEEEECGGVRRSEEEWGGVMTSLIINIRHNYMQWCHAGVFKQGCVRLAD
jgi:hypothetical protein